MATRRKAGKKALWSTQDMERAMEACKDGLVLRAAAAEWKVPTSTLKRHLDGGNKYAVGPKRQLGRGIMLPEELEDELACTILSLERSFFGLTRKEVMEMAFDLAEKRNIPHSFNRDKRSAGKDWLRFFLVRHPQLSVRSPESTSMNSLCGFNRESVSMFFDMLSKLIDEHNFDRNSMLMRVEFRQSKRKNHKIIGQKGKHQIGTLSSAERGQNTTVVCCMSASGQYVPPMIIFKRKRMPPELADGKPAGSVVLCNESGWMQKETFCVWLRHFISVVKPNPQNKVLLILDGHTSHTKNLEAIDLARANGVILLSLPAHTTHKLQPLDISFFKPLQHFYNKAIQRWLRTNPGRTVGHHICSFFNEAYSKAASIATAVNGFRKSGVWPCNMHFADHEFLEGHQTIEQDGAGQQPSVYEVYTAEDAVHRPHETANQESNVENESEQSNNACNISIIRTAADGRCFFRSLAICLDSGLQKVERDQNGYPKNAIDRLAETAKADELRAATVSFMCKNRPTNSLPVSVLNADVPPQIGLTYRSLEERIQSMTDHKHMPGELEIISTAKMLRQQIRITNEDGAHISSYGNEFSTLLQIRFTALGNDVGHYGSVIVSPSTGPTAVSSPSTGPTAVSSPSTGPTVVSSPSTGPTACLHQALGLQPCLHQALGLQPCLHQALGLQPCLHQTLGLQPCLQNLLEESVCFSNDLIR